MDTEITLSDIFEKFVELVKFISNPISGIVNLVNKFTEVKNSIVTIISEKLANRLFDCFSELRPFFTKFGMSFLNFCSVSSFGDIKTIFFMLLGVAFFALLVKVILFFF